MKLRRLTSKSGIKYFVRSHGQVPPIGDAVTVQFGTECALDPTKVQKISLALSCSGTLIACLKISNEDIAVILETEGLKKVEEDLFLNDDIDATVETERWSETAQPGVIAHIIEKRFLLDSKLLKGPQNKFVLRDVGNGRQLTYQASTEIKLAIKQAIRKDILSTILASDGIKMSPGYGTLKELMCHPEDKVEEIIEEFMTESCLRMRNIPNTSDKKITLTSKGEEYLRNLETEHHTTLKQLESENQNPNASYDEVLKLRYRTSNEQVQSLLKKINNAPIAAVIAEDIHNAVMAFEYKLYKLSLISSGSAIEGLLAARLRKTAPMAEKNKVENMTLDQLLNDERVKEIIAESNIKFADGVRFYRNYVHPFRYLREIRKQGKGIKVSPNNAGVACNAVFIVLDACFS